MSAILQQFKKVQLQFDEERNKEEGNKVMIKVVAIVNELGKNFSKLDGGELSEIQMKLAGYKFYLADYISELLRNSEALKIDIKEARAKRWDEITEVIRSEKGKVSNKEQIENVIIIETRQLSDQQILFETMYYKYKLKLSAIDDILTAIVQRIAELKKQVEQSKSL